VSPCYNVIFETILAVPRKTSTFGARVIPHAPPHHCDHPHSLACAAGFFFSFTFPKKRFEYLFFFQIWSLKNKSQISIVRKGSVEGQIWKERKNNDRKNEKKKEKGSLVQSIYSQFTIHNGFKNKTPHLLQCFCYLELRGSLLDKSLFRAGYD